MNSKKIEPRFIAGPPGTGKTHEYIVDLYQKELLPKYHPDKIRDKDLKENAKRQFQEITEAYNQIKDRKG